MLNVRRHFFTTVAGIIFLLVGMLHGIRVLYGWEVTFNGWMVPMWVSLLAVLLGFLMALAAVQHMR